MVEIIVAAIGMCALIVSAFISARGAKWAKKTHIEVVSPDGQPTGQSIEDIRNMLIASTELWTRHVKLPAEDAHPQS